MEPRITQKDNVAYGTSLSTATNLLVPEQALVKFIVPSDNALGTTWTGGQECPPYERE